MNAPETRCARSGDVHIAFPGDGPFDLVFRPGLRDARRDSPDAGGVQARASRAWPVLLAPHQVPQVASDGAMRRRPRARSRPATRRCTSGPVPRASSSMPPSGASPRVVDGRIASLTLPDRRWTKACTSAQRSTGSRCRGGDSRPRRQNDRWTGESPRLKRVWSSRAPCRRTRRRPPCAPYGPGSTARMRRPGGGRHSGRQSPHPTCAHARSPLPHPPHTKTPRRACSYGRSGSTGRRLRTTPFPPGRPPRLGRVLRPLR